MGELLDRPFAFFGHCLGALTMYETARRLIHTTMFRPEHLFASGGRPPDRIADQGLFEERAMHDLLKLAEFRISLRPMRSPMMCSRSSFVISIFGRLSNFSAIPNCGS